MNAPSSTGSKGDLAMQSAAWEVWMRARHGPGSDDAVQSRKRWICLHPKVSFVIGAVTKTYRGLLTIARYAVVRPESPTACSVAALDGVTILKMLPSGSLNHAVFIAPAT